MPDNKSNLEDEAPVRPGERLLCCEVPYKAWPFKLGEEVIVAKTTRDKEPTLPNFVGHPAKFIGIVGHPCGPKKFRWFSIGNFRRPLATE